MIYLNIMKSACEEKRALNSRNFVKPPVLRALRSWAIAGLPAWVFFLVTYSFIRKCFKQSALWTGVNIIDCCSSWQSPDAGGRLAFALNDNMWQYEHPHILNLLLLVEGRKAVYGDYRLLTACSVYRKVTIWNQAGESQWLFMSAHLNLALDKSYNLWL